MIQEKKQVLFNSDEAAQYRTNLSGWVSRGGRYCGNDERAARYDGCTQMICEDCGKPCDKGWLVCKECSNKRDKKRYESLPVEVWNEVGMIYSDAADRYFSNWDEVDDFLEDEGGDIEGLRLTICEPQYLPLLDPSEFGCDSLAEDGELPDAVVDAIEKFNVVIRKTGAVSWYPGKKRAVR
jgi:hypothetical protein